MSVMTAISLIIGALLLLWLGGIHFIQPGACG